MSILASWGGGSYLKKAESFLDMDLNYFHTFRNDIKFIEKGLIRNNEDDIIPSSFLLWPSIR